MCHINKNCKLYNNQLNKSAIKTGDSCSVRCQEVDNAGQCNMALRLADEAGHILLENGAEIDRVEDTMTRIADHYGVPDGSFFVLSNGIISTGNGNKFAQASYIPIHGACLDKIDAVNQISRDVTEGDLTLHELEERLKKVRSMPARPVWEQVIGSAVGAATFAILFKGSLSDMLVAGVAGGVMWLFEVLIAGRYLSRLLGSICGGLVAAVICILCFKLGMGQHLGNIVIGAIIPLVPGIPFTNGIRDIANEDYLAGTTRMLDALMQFLCIAGGVILAFLIDGYIEGNIIRLSGMVDDPITSRWGWQIFAAFSGTTAFAIIFNLPRKHYVRGGLVGCLGWFVYLAATRWLCMSPVEGAFFSAMSIMAASRFFAVRSKCPATLFLVAGIIPLVPGGGLFWTSYYLVSNQPILALSQGFLCVKLMLAIALGIIVVNAIVQLRIKWKQ